MAGYSYITPDDTTDFGLSNVTTGKSLYFNDSDMMDNPYLLTTGTSSSVAMTNIGNEYTIRLPTAPGRITLHVDASGSDLEVLNVRRTSGHPVFMAPSVEVEVDIHDVAASQNFNEEVLGWMVVDRARALAFEQLQDREQRPEAGYGHYPSPSFNGELVSVPLVNSAVLGPHQLQVKNVKVVENTTKIKVEFMVPAEHFDMATWVSAHYNHLKARAAASVKAEVAARVRSNLLIKINKKENRKPINLLVEPQEQKARETLRDVITEAEWRRYVTNGFIMVKAASGLWYQVFADYGTRMRVYKDNKHIETLCIHSDKACPPTDHVVNMKIMLEIDEQSVRAGANVTQQYTAPIDPVAATNLLASLSRGAGGVLQLNQDGSLPLVNGRTLPAADVWNAVGEGMKHHIRSQGLPVLEDIEREGEVRAYIAAGIFERSALRSWRQMQMRKVQGSLVAVHSKAKSLSALKVAV